MKSKESSDMTSDVAHLEGDSAEDRSRLAHTPPHFQVPFFAASVTRRNFNRTHRSRLFSHLDLDPRDAL